jgi:hydroxymethylbilane synthase
MSHGSQFPILRLGGRGSPLSVVQLEAIQAQLAASAGVGNALEAFPITTFTTTGDRITDRKLIEAGGKGLFTKELDEALLDGRIDIAVHCLKDMPTKLPEGIIVAATPEREDPRDALITLEGLSLEALPQGSVLGTASLRRQAQLLAARPDLTIVTLRGNVGTRLAKLESSEVAATCLARAGLSRLGKLGQAHTILDPQSMPPAAGQGALALCVNAENEAAVALVSALDHAPTRQAIAAERAFLEALDGSCRTAIGAWARVENDRFRFVGEALTADGSKVWRRENEAAASISDEEARQIGWAAGRSIRTEAGSLLFADI